KNQPRLDGFPDVDELMKRHPGALPEEHAKQLRQQMLQMRNMMEQMLKQFPEGGNFPGMPGGEGFPQMPQMPQFQMPNAPWGNFNGRFGQQQEPRLGVRLDKPSATLVDQLDLPKGQGLILEEVVNNSAASKAGLKPHDILLEFDGKPVPNDVQE